MSAHESPRSNALRLRVTPSGRIALDDDPDAWVALSPAVTRRIRDAFARGPGEGLLHLGGAELTTALPASLAWGRDLGRSFLTHLRAVPELEARRGDVEVECPSGELQELREAMPWVQGSEGLTDEAMSARWSDMLAAFGAALGRHQGTVQSWFATLDPAWHLVGRVHLHLVENKQNPAAPFAFMATYTTRMSAAAALQHLPLGKALQEYAGARDHAALLSLLTPVKLAAERSETFRALVDSGEIYRPQAWSPAQALRFLREVPALQDAGLIVRIPDWWSARSAARPQVQVTVGDAAPGVITADAMLSFDVSVSLGGEALTEEEWEAIRAGAEGLVSLRGRWVEVDRAKLDAVLAYWKSAQRAAREGVGFHDALRMLAGVPLGAGGQSLPEGDAGWTRVSAGPWMASLLEQLRDPSKVAAVEAGRDLRATLRPYQREGVQWLWLLSSLGLGACLADDMGLGKTLQVLALLVVRARERAKGKAKRAQSLLVAPASLLANWRAEAARFTPTLKLVVAHPSAMAARALEALATDEAQLAEADLVVTSYGTAARAPWIAARTWDLVVLDEAQAIKNPGAQQSRAVKALKGAARIALTGTPVENRAGDLWSLFDFLAPGLLGTSAAFGRAAARMTESGGWEPLRRLVRPYVLRRLKTDKRVIADLPDKTELNAYCPLTAVQAGLYQRVVDRLAAKLAESDGIERRGAILAALMAFKQVCNHPSQHLGDGRWDPADSGKFGRLAELCEPIAARQEKALVFTQFREMTDALSAFLAEVFGREGLVLHGATAVKERQRLVDVFQRDESVPFFVLSLKAGGTGLNLTAASHVIHFDRWWNPAVENQATDRAFRIGQRRNVLVHRFVCRGTVEERIDALMERKRALSDALMAGDGDEVRLTEMSNDEVLKMVSLDLESALKEA